MGWVMNAKPRPLYPRERPGTHCVGGWVDPRAGWTGAENLASLGFDPWNLWPTASRYSN